MSRCECAGCGLLFTGVSAFDRHQAWERDGTFTGCLDPAEVRRGDGGPRFSIWRRVPDGRPVWGRGLLPGEDPDARSRGHREEIPAFQGDLDREG